MDVTNCPECSQKFNTTSDTPHEIENVLHILRNSITASNNGPPSEALLRFVKQQAGPLEFEMCIDCCHTLQKAVDVHMDLADTELQEYESVLSSKVDAEILAETARMKKMIPIHNAEIAKLEYELKQLTCEETVLLDKNKKLAAAYEPVEMENIALMREYNRCKREITGSYVSKARSTSSIGHHRSPVGTTSAKRQASYNEADPSPTFCE
uniref:Beclin-1 n=1 Tax=Panagrellus redivivus TaxID=6233 RepID=A0A7E4ZWM3_PANRE